jgi:hypothetical protein
METIQQALVRPATLDCARCALGEAGICTPVAEAVMAATPNIGLERYRLPAPAHAKIALSSLVSREQAIAAAEYACLPQPKLRTEIN